MTIEMAVKMQGSERKQVLGYIAAGAFGSFFDYSEAKYRTVSVHCLPDDNGGEVYAFDNEGFLETPSLRATPAEAYTEENLEAYIPAGGKYERDIITETRKRGRVILTHIIET